MMLVRSLVARWALLATLLVASGGLPGVVGQARAQTVKVRLHTAASVGPGPYYLQVGPVLLLSDATQEALAQYKAAQTRTREEEAAEVRARNVKDAAQATATQQAAAARTARNQASAATAALARATAGPRRATQARLALLRQDTARANPAARSATKLAEQAAAALTTATTELAKASRTAAAARQDSTAPGKAARQRYAADPLVQRSLISTYSVLPAFRLAVDLDDDTPYEVAQRVLRNLRRAARATHGTRLVASASPEWNPLLLPRPNLLRRKFTTGRRRARRMFLANLQAELEQQFDSALAQRTLAGQPVSPAGAGSPVALKAPAAVPSKAASSLSSILYDREVVFTTVSPSTLRAERRVLHLQLADDGSSAPERYRTCVSYTTGGQGTFVNSQPQGATTNCPAAPGTVSASLRFANLERTLFVEKIMLALSPGNQVRTDAAPLDYQALLTAQAAAVRQNDAARAAFDTVAHWQARKVLLTDALAGVEADASKRAQLSSLNDSLKQAPQKLKKQTDKAQQSMKAVTDALQKAGISADSAAKKGIVLQYTSTDAGATTLRETLTDLYLDYARQQTLLLAAPMAGVLDVLPQGNVYYPNVTRPHDAFVPDSVEVEVEDGAVIGLKATGHLAGGSGQTACFESRSPVGISSDRDLYTEWQRQRLWLQYPLLNHGPVHSAYVPLTDLLRYYPALTPEGGDRSPANGVYVVHRGDPLARRTFTKIATQKILQGRIYTDLAGVRSENPNGLVQLEVNRKFSFGAPWSKFSPDFQFQILGYFTPFVAINKLEQQNRYLPLERTAQRGTYLVHTIDLLRYTNFRVGGDYNLVGVRLPRFKSDITLDFGFALHRVDLRDTVTRVSPTLRHFRVDSTLNVGTYGFSLKARIRPDSRYSVTARVGYFRYVLINDRDPALFIRQVPNPDDTPFMAGRHTLFARYWYEGVIQYELTGRLKIAENAEYFIRPQFSHSLYYSYRTFFQIQTGFQFDIFGPRREAPPGVALPNIGARRAN